MSSSDEDVYMPDFEEKDDISIDSNDDDDADFDDAASASDDDDDFDAQENVAPTTKTSSKAKKKPTKASNKKTKPNVLSTNTNADNVTTTSKGKKKTVEETYQKKTQLEHILLRPDTYVGSVERITQPMIIFDKTKERLVQREITFTPGLFKIFDEIVVTAADNKQRDPNMDRMEIHVDPEANTISVKNNGKGIPVVMHKEHDCYVPTLIFGHLLTGSNFDDDEKKTTGGRNGYGAKLANIFSKEFIVECVDAENNLKFKQVFRDNMNVSEKPTVKKCTVADKKYGDSTKITFSPDLPRFGMQILDEDIVGLMSKRAYDIAATMANRAGKKLSVSLNGTKIPVKTFRDYVKLLDGFNPPVAYEKIGDRWEVGVALSEGTAQQVSFVNAISTSKGGGHVNYIVDQVAAHLVKAVKKKNKGGTDVKPNQVKNHLCVFVNCLVENPAFDSQTKEFLTTRAKSFGSECTLSDKFLKQVEKGGIVDAILSFARFKQGEALKRKGGAKKTKLTGIAKLDDANFAGGAKSKDCTLIITEGDSAKSLAMSGLSVVGRDYYGVFPLRGKPLNVRDATHKQMMTNEEIKNLVQILGLKFDTVYDETNIKTLRYGHLMIMADQDHDGSHIKGLVINFLHNFWPTLLDVPGFLQQFITPIVKATKGKKSLTFFTLPEYDAWRESTGNDGKGYSIKYYKGLGTSTSAEAKEYFSNLDLHEVHFSKLSIDSVDDEKDDDAMEVEDAPVPDLPASGSDLIDMVFRKARVDDRKVWLNNFSKDTFLDYSRAQRSGVKYSEFINKEFILFSKSDCQRSIPHFVDGFKPSQRKVLFACIKRKLKGEIKVAQLAGYIGEHSAYHHGEASLHGTIVNMAQSFVGSNNVNLLTPSGQFGTRRMGGKDAASPRYIFTKLEPITRTIFHPDDDELLNYLNDDGLSIEPEYYVPVIPMVLVNGSDGIGTGWSSTVPNYDPREIIQNIRRLIAGEDIAEMKPFYSGWTGEIVTEEGKREGSFVVRGRIERVDEATLLITELPIKKWTQDYKKFLEEMLEGDSKGSKPDIKDFKENHTDTTVSFTIQAEKEKIDEFEKEKNGLMGKFKLLGSLSTTNMNLFNIESQIIKYPAPETILLSFYSLRLEFYEKRKKLLVHNLQREQKMLSNKARFVEEVCSGELIVSNRKRAELLAELRERGYDTFDKNSEQASDDDSSEDSEIADDNLSKGYDYLLSMKIWSLTYEKAEELRAQLAEKTKALAELEATPPHQLWLNDLDAIEDALDQRDVEIAEAANEEKKAQKRNTKHQAKKKAKAAKRRKKGNEWNSDMEDDSSDEDLDSDAEFVPSKKKPAGARARGARGGAKPAAAKKSAVTKAVVEKGDVEMKDSSKDDDSVTTKEVSNRKSGGESDPIASLRQSKSLVVDTADHDTASTKSLSPTDSDSLKSNKTAPKRGQKKSSRGTKRPSPRASDKSDDDDDSEASNFDAAEDEPASAASKAKKSKPAPKRVRGAATAAKKATSAKTTKGRKPAAAKKKAKEDDAFHCDEVISDVEEEEQPKTTRTRRTRAPVKSYAIDSDDDSIDSTGSE